MSTAIATSEPTKPDVDVMPASLHAHCCSGSSRLVKDGACERGSGEKWVKILRRTCVDGHVKQDLKYGTPARVARAVPRRIHNKMHRSIRFSGSLTATIARYHQGRAPYRMRVNANLCSWLRREARSVDTAG